MRSSREIMDLSAIDPSVPASPNTSKGLIGLSPDQPTTLMQEGGPIELLLSRPLRALAFDALEVERLPPNFAKSKTCWSKNQSELHGSDLEVLPF